MYHVYLDLVKARDSRTLHLRNAFEHDISCSCLQNLECSDSDQFEPLYLSLGADSQQQDIVLLPPHGTFRLFCQIEPNLHRFSRHSEEAPSTIELGR